MADYYFGNNDTVNEFLQYLIAEVIIGIALRAAHGAALHYNHPDKSSFHSPQTPFRAGSIDRAFFRDRMEP